MRNVKRDQKNGTRDNNIIIRFTLSFKNEFSIPFLKYNEIVFCVCEYLTGKVYVFYSPKKKFVDHFSII